MQPSAAVAGPSPDRPATCVDVDEFRNVFTGFFGAPPDAFEFGCPRADLFARGAFGGGGAGLFGDGFGAGFASSTPSTTEAPLTLTLEELFKGAQPYPGLPYPTLASTRALPAAVNAGARLQCVTPAVVAFWTQLSWRQGGDRRCAAGAGGEKRLALSRRIYDGASGASVRVREEVTIRVQPGWQEGHRCAPTKHDPVSKRCLRSPAG